MGTQLTGKVAIVTGGGRGIGRSIALALAAEGADVCVTARSTEEIEAVAAEIAGLGPRGRALACDVGDPAAVQSMIDQTFAELGHIDILVNNAGGAFVRNPVADSDPSEWKQTLDVNLLGAYYCIRAALPHLIAADDGKVINIGSGMGHTPRAGNSAYNVAKAGLWMLTRCLALEVWEQGVSVNEVIPGPVYTRLTEGYFQPPGQAAPPVAASERVKTPEECVPLVMFLATHPPGGPTGQSFSLARRPL